MRKHILVTGANTGIGYYFVEKLLERGYNVTVLDLRTNNLEGLRNKYPGKLLPIICDAGDTKSIYLGVKQAFVRYGRIDIAVHNASQNVLARENELDLVTYERIMNVNYFGALRLVKSVLPYMKLINKGRIIFTGSAISATGFNCVSSYAASKSAVETLAKCLRLENKNSGISFHVFEPPLTDTKAIEGIAIPDKYKADPQEIGYALADKMWKRKFMICPKAKYTLMTKFVYRHPVISRHIMMRSLKHYENIEKNKQATLVQTSQTN